MSRDIGLARWQVQGALLLVVAVLWGNPVGAGEAVDSLTTRAPIRFNRDVRPILSDKCFACHGPDKNKREADLRLDTQAGLLGQNDEPGVVIASRIDESKLYLKISAEDAAERMPPEDFGKPLSAEEIDVLRRWIEQGAAWEGHWSLNPMEGAAPPAVEDSAGWAANDVDRFILAALREHGLSPSPEADPRTLIRRLSLDLAGLPPSMEQVARFVGDPSDAAYEQAVDEMLASPHYAERMAMWWLDLVRYADSVGYHGDQEVSVYPFREYVIRAFQANKPFDVFTREQLAGDLLPTPTLEQRIASGYNRLGMMSAEGGVQDKEYLAKYAAERVRTLGGTWLGATLGCCECHDHKYDSYQTRDFYSLEAFFADIEERGLYSGANADGNWGPRIQLPTPEQAQRQAELEAQVAATRQRLDTSTADLEAAQAIWEQSPDAPPPPIAEILAVARDLRTAEQKATLAAHFRSVTKLLEPARTRLPQLEAELAALWQAIPTTLVTASATPRMIRVLARGNWMDESGEIVDPAFPSCLPSAPAQGRRLNRLDLAEWLTAPDNPLTARVFVNRVWKLFFGAGLSRKLDDLGAQGEWPSHPELLDALAADFRDHGWDVKRLVKQIVLSSTYRQSSLTNAAANEIDPANRWLSRQSSYRLDAECVRDNALAISGLLVDQLGGPSVRPYQPPGFWAYLNFPQREWQNSSGDALYRRGLYTHWQRQYLHPSLTAFDAPSREECTADRPRSNTPMQALVLLNDPTYVEAARAFAAKLLLEGGPSTESRIQWAFERAVMRPARSAEIDALTRLVEKHLADYRSDAQAVDALASIGAKPWPEELDRAELAAWTSVTRAILNLHESITRN